MRDIFFVNDSAFSAGGVLIDFSKQMVFLIFKDTSQEWLLPKGHIEHGETIESTAEREIFEETGYKNSIKNLLSVQIREDFSNLGKHKIIFWFLSLKLPGGKNCNTQKNNENFTGEWCTKTHALKILKYDEDKQIVSKAFEIMTEFSTNK